MASTPGPALAHRNVANIRAAPNQGQTGTTPSTPPRNAPATYGSPSTIRADDDFLIIEIGSRFMRVGFAGDNLPKAVLTFGPESQRRAGDFRDWQRHGEPDLNVWAEDHEIWQCNMRETELGLIHDRLDRLLRDAFTRCLLIDSRPRRAGLVLDSAVPIPLLSAVLDLLFKGFQAPMISLMSAATMTTVAAGIRSALVIDMGWKETVVTSVYECREVKCTRTVRGGKFLHAQLYKTLRKLLTGKDEDDGKRVISFTECEDIMHRLMWCRPSAYKSAQRQRQRESAQLDTVVEQDESEAKLITSIPLRSTAPAKTIEISFDEIANICDDTFFDTSVAPTTFDDHEVPIHLLVYQHLVQLPIDVRAVCMSRLILTGGCSNILGIKERVVDEVTSMVNRKGWANVSGKNVEETRNSQFSDRRASSRSAGSQATATTTTTTAAVSETGEEQEFSGPSSIATQIDADPIEAKVARHRPKTEPIQGQFRTIHSLGPWAGASLVCQLKVPAMATIDRELWLQQGASGASRPSEVDIKAQQRQSMGTGGFIRGSGGHHTNWTLGTWGSI
ncbi:Actin-related 10-like protein [Cladobotryum mycophilum]|uniref:Actin-related 10-like protein n=1 Tax=Cladobotryum mycophilum TaxID=491253 RepID=A0ABR0SA94_9HYPO